MEMDATAALPIWANALLGYRPLAPRASLGASRDPPRHCFHYASGAQRATTRRREAKLQMSQHPATAKSDARQRGLVRGFSVLAGLTLCLIVVGALVRAHDAGLACPDWPLCTGAIVPQFDVKIAFEWGHRVFAALISFGLLGLSILVLRDSALRQRMGVQLGLCWLVLCAQVIFGALTVWLLLAPWTVSVHLVLGNTFCMALLWISRDLTDSSSSSVAPASIAPPVTGLIVLAAVCLVAQIVLGGLVSSHYAGLACTEFPTCDGERFVPTLQGALGLHVLHRLNGYALAAVFTLLAVVSRHTGRIDRLAALACGLVWLQVGIGVTNVLMRIPYQVTGLHTGVGAVIVLTTSLMVREIVHARSARPRAREARRDEGRARRLPIVGRGIHSEIAR